MTDCTCAGEARGPTMALAMTIVDSRWNRPKTMRITPKMTTTA